MSQADPPSDPVPREPFANMLLRNLLLATGVGAGLAIRSHSLQRWFPASLVMLWPTLGGHYLELAFLDLVRPRLTRRPPVRTLARVLTWMAGGVLFAMAMHLTGSALGDAYFVTWPPLWLGAVGMIGIELIAHTALRLRGLPSFFDTWLTASRAT